jgi:hypothetical protein
MELRLAKGGFEFLLAGFFLGILFAFTFMLNYYGEPVTLEAILLILILAILFVSLFYLGNRKAKSRKVNLPITYWISLVLFINARFCLLLK